MVYKVCLGSFPPGPRERPPNLNSSARIRSGQRKPQHEHFHPSTTTLGSISHLLSAFQDIKVCAFNHWSFRSLLDLLTLFLVCSSCSGTAPVAGLCALGFNSSRVYEIQVVTLALGRSDAPTRNRRKDNSGEAAKENESVFFFPFCRS